jgi:hypothetical protein
MGILDDAIREHLELKRAHGASEQEVRQQEAEAFGPARQDVVPEPPPAEAALAEHEPALAEHEPAQEPAEDPYAVHPGDHPVPDPHDHVHPAGSDPAWREDTELFAEPAAPPPPPAHQTEERHPALHDTDEHLRASSHAPEPVFGHQPAGAPEAPVSPPAPVEEPEPEEPPVEQPPVEEPPVEGDDEDVLEETPEFLQDAPEHDRLWFEQRPPRDFDFGE